MSDIVLAYAYTVLDITTAICAVVPEPLVPAVFFAVFILTLFSPVLLPMLAIVVIFRV